MTFYVIKVFTFEKTVLEMIVDLLNFIITRVVVMVTKLVLFL